MFGLDAFDGVTALLDLCRCASPDFDGAVGSAGSVRFDWVTILLCRILVAFLVQFFMLPGYASMCFAVTVRFFGEVMCGWDTILPGVRFSEFFVPFLCVYCVAPASNRPLRLCMHRVFGGSVVV